MYRIELRRVAPADVQPIGQDTLDDATLAQAREILADVAARGAAAVREHAERLNDIAPAAPLILDRSALNDALRRIGTDDRAVLERTAGRIRTFAAAQRACLSDLATEVPGGWAGHDVAPVESAGCYAPGGRFPLPSSVLMTAVTARVAGVENVIVASPRPTDITLAAAAIAEANALLAVGGAQAIGAFTTGIAGVPRCDVIVGPGNRWVTAAKQLVAGRVAIDMLAGPSELAVVSDARADAELVAADLLAQAEHDPDARPVLVTLNEAMIKRVEQALNTQLADLPTADTARAALSQGFAVVAANADEAVAVCDRLAPEHLALHVDDSEWYQAKLRHYGAIFLGSRSAEVLGDYGIGPNHVLPTGGTARAMGGLSVFNFLRMRTWLRAADGPALHDVARDAAALARLERLEAHARSAERRLPSA